MKKRVEFNLENTEKLRLSQKEIRLLKMRAMLPKSMTDVELICLIEDETNKKGKKRRRLTI